MRNTYAIMALGVVVGLMVFGGQVFAQALNDPAKDGMRVLPRVEGCNVPGGLRPITSSDGPYDAPFWCGPPPYCLTMPVGSPERCHITPGVRQGGLRGVRDPQDLICDVTNTNPTGPAHATPGRCPVAPTLGATVNGVQVATVSQGANVTLRVNTASTAPLSTPTSLTMACTGTNAAISPFNQTNLSSYAGQDHTFSAAVASSSGNTVCDITATNAAGTTTQQVSFNATPTVTTPRPTVSASFSPLSGFTGGTTIRLITNTTNATSLSYSCSGAPGWSTTRSRGTGSQNTGEGTPSGAYTVNCTFTASGAGGTASTSASWRSNASSGSGSGSGSGYDPLATSSCPALTVRVVGGQLTPSGSFTGQTTMSANNSYARTNCEFQQNIAAGTTGTVRNIGGQFSGKYTETCYVTARLTCQNGRWNASNFVGDSYSN